MAYMYSSSSSLLNAYSSFDEVLGGEDCSFLGDNEDQAAWTFPLPPPCTGDVRLDEPLEDTKLVAALSGDKNDINVAAPPEMDNDDFESYSEQLESMLEASDNDYDNNAENEDQENNKNSIVVVEAGEKEDSVNMSDQEKHSNNNNDNMGEEEQVLIDVNNDMLMAAPQQTTPLNVFPAAGNAMHVSNKTSSSTRAPRVKWTDEEHNQYLIGLGVNHRNRGKWKLISQEFIPTKSRAQVASHAQKYFNNLDSTHLAAADNNVVAPPPEMDTELYLDPDALEAVSPEMETSELYLDMDLLEVEPLPPAEDTLFANQLMVSELYEDVLFEVKDEDSNNNAHAPPQQPMASSSRAPREVWTEEEQKQFLTGLGENHCNKGKWKLVSQFVPTKSTSQITSHAQKYFKHLDSIRLAAAAADAEATNKRKRRRSIHDTTL